MFSKKEVARDIIALGSIPFYLLVMARSAIGVYWIFLIQLAVALVALGVLAHFMKKANQYMARILVLAIFTTLFYNDVPFTVFVFLLVIGLGYSLHYLKKKGIGQGIIVGLIASAVGYAVSLMTFT